MPLAPPQRRFDSCLLLLAQVTKQTGPAGKPVNTLYIASKLDLAKEMYFAILLDRKSAGTMIIACGEGKLDKNKRRLVLCLHAITVRRTHRKTERGSARTKWALLQSSPVVLDGML